MSKYAIICQCMVAYVNIYNGYNGWGSCLAPMSYHFEIWTQQQTEAFDIQEPQANSHRAQSRQVLKSMMHKKTLKLSNRRLLWAAPLTFSPRKLAMPGNGSELSRNPWLGVITTTTVSESKWQQEHGKWKQSVNPNAPEQSARKWKQCKARQISNVNSQCQSAMMTSVFTHAVSTTRPEPVESWQGYLIDTKFATGGFQLSYQWITTSEPSEASPLPPPPISPSMFWALSPTGNSSSDIASPSPWPPPASDPSTSTARALLANIGWMNPCPGVDTLRWQFKGQRDILVIRWTSLHSHKQWLWKAWAQGRAVTGPSCWVKGSKQMRQLGTSIGGTGGAALENAPAYGVAGVGGTTQGSSESQGNQAAPPLLQQAQQRLAWGVQQPRVVQAVQQPRLVQQPRVQQPRAPMAQELGRWQTSAAAAATYHPHCPKPPVLLQHLATSGPALASPWSSKHLTTHAQQLQTAHGGHSGSRGTWKELMPWTHSYTMPPLASFLEGQQRSTRSGSWFLRRWQKDQWREWMAMIKNKYINDIKFQISSEVYCRHTNLDNASCSLTWENVKLMHPLQLQAKQLSSVSFWPGFRRLQM